MTRIPAADRSASTRRPRRTVASDPAADHDGGHPLPDAKRLAAVPAQPPGKPSRDKLTVSEVCAELQIAPSTFYDWRTKGTGPRCIKLPNGQLRVRRTALEAWCNAREDAA